MGIFLTITLGVLVAFLPGKVLAQTAGDPCTTTADCTTLLNEECDGSVCVCLAGYETQAGGTQCLIKDCGTLDVPANGDPIIYSQGTTYQSVALYYCSTGYNMSGSDTRSCLEDGTWSGAAPTCVKKDCGALTVPTNGAIDNTLTTYQEQVTFTCDTGYNLNGDATLTCTDTGVWSYDSPTCDIVDCGSLTAPINGNIVQSGTTYLQTTTYTCKVGYDLSASATRTCEADGQWTDSDPSCIIRVCGALTTPTDGTVMYSSGTIFGSQATITCDPGHDLVGTSILVCQMDGTWSSTEPTCPIRDCGNLATPIDGTRIYSSGTTYGSTATFSCNAGHDLMGTADINCQVDGSWDGIDPTCQVKDCGTLTAPINGGVAYNTGTTEYPTVATFTCNTGYTLAGSSTSSCQTDGTWNNTGPTCSIVTCPVLTAPTDGTIAYSQEQNYRSNAVFSCNLGHSLIGDSLLVCQSNSMWNGTKPFCTINDCGSLSSPVNGAKATETGTTYGSTTTFTCNTGYVMIGSASVNCQADGTWSDGTPTCNIKDCGSVAAPSDGTISSTTGTSYQNNITFSCSAGYTLTGPMTIVCQADGTWSNTAPTCVIKNCGTLATPTNGQLSLSSGTTFGSMVTFSCNTGYELTGRATLNCDTSGIWDGTAPTCTIVDCGTLSDPANGGQTTPTTIYQSSAVFSCDPGYTLTGFATSMCQDDGTWNNPAPTCIIKDCGGLTAPNNGVMSNPGGFTTYLTTVTFTCNSGYDLFGSAALRCDAGGDWNTTVPICVIKDCLEPSPINNGNIDTTGGTTYSSVATYTCNTGYTRIGANQRTCQADGTWSSTNPTCQIVDCNILTAPAFGNLTLPGGTTYQSVAFFQCNLGYALDGDNTRTCQDDFSWSGATPNCQINDCGSLTSPTNGTVMTPDGTTYQEVATYMCDTGFTLIGASSRTCQANADWSGVKPTCRINDCGTLSAPTNGQVDLSGGTVYLSVATFTCNAGYDLTGVTTLTCLSDGNWQTPSPTCVIKDCGSLGHPGDGLVDIGSGTTYQSVATYTCTLGYEVQGDVTRTCTANGTWDGSEPTCARKDCGVLTAPLNGTVTIDYGTLYEANATFDCDLGFTLSGSMILTCVDTGSWDPASPVCEINDCGPLLAPLNGSVTTAGGTTYQEVAMYNCDPGFTLTGTSMQTCLADTTWNDTAPTCVIKDCGTLTAPLDGSVTFNPNTEFESFANFTCSIGYTLNGSASRECVASGMWDAATPVCDINDCGVLTSPADGFVNQSDGTTYLRVSYYTCNIGHTLNGVVSRLCQANSTWSDTSPVCDINDCGTITDPVNGTVDLSDGTVYQSVAMFQCDIGFDLNGTADRECLAPGVWEMPFPFCQIKDCGIPATPQYGSVNISGETTYLSTISYSCEDGFDLSGAVVRICDSDGNWTDEDPQCLRRDCGNLTVLEFGDVIYQSWGTLYQGIAEYNCSRGFNLTTGDKYRVCQEDMTWNGTEPVCITEDCGPVLAPANGQVSTPGGTTFLQIAYYVCNSGYDLVGDSTRTCTDVAGVVQWSSMAPTCVIKNCGQLVDPNNGAVDLSNGTAFASKAIYSCVTGYVVNGLVTRVCNRDGAWTGDDPTCEYADCGTPPSIANGAATVDDGTLYLATGTYTCNAGYTMVGSAMITCLGTGDWDAIPTCSRDCGTPPTVAKGKASYPNGTLAGDTATYTCEDGYNLSGTPTITCTSTGEWTNEPFCAIVLRNYNETCSITSQCITPGATCRDNGQGAKQCICAATGEYYDQVINECLADCGALSDPTNGIVTLPDVTAAGQVARYTCDVGYALSGVAVRVCLTTGLWSSRAPTCITGCSTLDPPENGYVNTSAGRVAGKKAYYTCNPGYALIGVEQTVCLEDSTWNNPAPICLIECPSLGDINHGTVDLSLGHWEDSLAVYICEKDYALVGASTRTCQSTGIWSGVPPECIFAIFPDVLLGFGIVLIVIVLVDVAILGFCLYIKYSKPKKEDPDDLTDLDGKDPSEMGYPSIFEEKPAVSIPPMMSSNMRQSGHKPRPARITPEGNKNHPPPRKPKIDRPLYKYTVKPKTEIPDPGAGQQPVGRLEPLRQQGNRSSRELQLEEFNHDDPMLSDDSRKGAPDEDQISLFDEPNADQPTHRRDSPTDLSARPNKAQTLASEGQEQGNVRARMSVPKK